MTAAPACYIAAMCATLAPQQTALALARLGALRVR